MPQAIGAFLLPASASAATAAAVGTTVMVGGAMVGMSAYQSSTAAKGAKSAAAELDRRSQQAVADLKTEQANASTMAQNAVNARRTRMIAGSSTIFTNPLGIAGLAETSKKTLLGS